MSPAQWFCGVCKAQPYFHRLRVYCRLLDDTDQPQAKRWSWLKFLSSTSCFGQQTGRRVDEWFSLGKESEWISLWRKSQALICTLQICYFNQRNIPKQHAASVSILCTLQWHHTSIITFMEYYYQQFNAWLFVHFEKNQISLIWNINKFITLTNSKAVDASALYVRW